MVGGRVSRLPPIETASVAGSVEGGRSARFGDHAVVRRGQLANLLTTCSGSPALPSAPRARGAFLPRSRAEPTPTRRDVAPSSRNEWWRACADATPRRL